MRERYDYQEPDPQPASAFVPRVKDRCICGEPFEWDGDVYQPRSPSCFYHGSRSRVLPPTARLWPDQRTTGVIKSRGPNRS